VNPIEKKFIVCFAVSKKHIFLRCLKRIVMRHLKLENRFKRLPSDFTFDELETLLRGYGLYLKNKGKTSGSRARFEAANGDYINTHRPHPGNVMGPSAMRDIRNRLVELGYITV
jgi:hypothetical protein